MCGFVGIWNFSDEPVRSETIEAMSEWIAHRGPDDTGVFVEGELGLSHRRLSIIDLSSAGKQPMSNNDKSLWVVYNGEIYNYLELTDELKALGHEFRTQCDTEVILHAYRQWGSSCVEKFNGMWAFAIWNPAKRELFCSRDQFGIKPFYYFVSNSHFLFASEIKALLVHPAVSSKVNAAALHRFLVYHVKDDGSETCFSEIKQIPPGHNLSVVRGRITLTSYWNIDFALDEQLARRSDQDLADEFRNLLSESIRLRLRSDVPVGITLSGGLDSNSIAALIARMHPNPLRAYSVNYPGTDHDESRYVDALLESYPNIEANIERPNGSDVAEVMAKTVWHNDEPCWGPAVYSWWHVMQNVWQGDVTVLLNGQGADELLAGYPLYYPTYLRQLLTRGNLLGFRQEYKEWRSAAGLGFMSGLKWLAAPLWPDSLRRLMPRRRGPRSYDDSFLHADFRSSARKSSRFDKKGFTTLAAHLQEDFAKSRLQELLHAEDRFSMAFSLESRVPFLDHRVVSFAARLPDAQKIQSGRTKVILRNAMRDRLPTMTIDRKDKMGYPTPAIEWLRTSGRDYVLDLLHSKAICEHSIFNVDELKRRFDLVCRGESKTRELWRWLSTEVWVTTFIDAPARASSAIIKRRVKSSEWVAPA